MDHTAPELSERSSLSCAANDIEYSVWIGGSILASLSTFQQMWIAKSVSYCSPSTR